MGHLLHVIEIMIHFNWLSTVQMFDTVVQGTCAIFVVEMLCLNSNSKILVSIEQRGA